MAGSLLATAGPFMGVRTNADAPYTNSSKYLATATNGYFRDVDGFSSWVARPAFITTNTGAQIGTGQRAQGSHAHVDPATQAIYRFFAVNGKLYRSNATFTVFTDVTPTGVTIDTAVTTRLSMMSVGASMVATDGVNRPWVASNFASTPITGTYIDIDGGGGAWSTWGPPTIYQDSVMWITATVPSGSAVEAGVGIVWSEPNQPAVGYDQSGYADFWNFIETGSERLTGILGTNSGLFVWRESSITVAVGTPSINFSSTATRDARGDAVGTVCPWAIAIAEDNIFFLDNRGRPWMMSLAGQPQPIWEQLATAANTFFGVDQTDLPYVAVGAIVPELNLYIFASTYTTSYQSPFIANVFSADDGNYNGQWQIGPSAGSGINTIGEQLDASGMRVLCVVGSLGAISPYYGGFVSILSSVTAAQWADSPNAQNVQITTAAMGFSASNIMNPDYVNIMVRSTDTIQAVNFTGSNGNTSPAVTSVVPLSNPSLITSYRAVVGLDGSATRYMSFHMLGPASQVTQWGVQRLEVFGSTCLAGPDDQ